MAKSGRAPRGGPARGRAAAGKPPKAAGKPPKKTLAKKAGQKIVFDAPAPAPDEPRVFRLGAVPGATPGRWIDTWNRRMPHVPLELVPVDAATQRTAIDELDAVLVRLPVEDATLHLIPLYEETPVVVASIESHLLAADELALSDLSGEILITPLDDVLGAMDIPGIQTPRFAPLDTTGEAIATAASGTGVVIVPMSLARMHQRKDADYRPLLDGPGSTVAIAWSRDRTTQDVETFVGIVRGRTANSSR